MRIVLGSVAVIVRNLHAGVQVLLFFFYRAKGARWPVLCVCELVGLLFCLTNKTDSAKAPRSHRVGPVDYLTTPQTLRAVAGVSMWTFTLHSRMHLGIARERGWLRREVSMVGSRCFLHEVSP